MNENELLEWIKDAAEQGKGFVEREAPLFVEELLAWYFWSSVMEVACGLALIIVAVVSVVVLFRLGNNFRDWIWESPLCVVWVVLSLIAVAAGMTAAIEGTIATVKVSVAPRLVVVEAVQVGLGGGR